VRSYFCGKDDAAEIVEPLGGVVVGEGGFGCFWGCGVGGLVMERGVGEGLGGIAYEGGVVYDAVV
jgi:hypothetical protein